MIKPVYTSSEKVLIPGLESFIVAPLIQITSFIDRFSGFRQGNKIGKAISDYFGQKSGSYFPLFRSFLPCLFWSTKKIKNIIDSIDVVSRPSTRIEALYLTQTILFNLSVSEILRWTKIGLEFGEIKSYRRFCIVWRNVFRMFRTLYFSKPLLITKFSRFKLQSNPCFLSIDFVRHSWDKNFLLDQTLL